MNTWAGGSYTAESIPFILSEYLYYQLRRRKYIIPTVVHSNQYVTRYFERDKDNLRYFNIDLHPDAQKNKYLARLRNFWSILTTKTYHGESSATDINKVALKTISRFSSPFFICLWYMDVHPPHFPPGETKLSDIQLNSRYKRTVLRRDSDYLLEGDIDKLIENYDKKIKYFDDSLFMLLSELPDKTIIILTADHGEEFMERGGLGHHEGEIPELRHVPLIIRRPHTKSDVVDRSFDFKYFDKFVLDIIDQEISIDE